MTDNSLMAELLTQLDLFLFHSGGSLGDEEAPTEIPRGCPLHAAMHAVQQNVTLPREVLTAWKRLLHLTRNCDRDDPAIAIEAYDRARLIYDWAEELAGGPVQGTPEENHVLEDLIEVGVITPGLAPRTMQELLDRHGGAVTMRELRDLGVHSQSDDQEMARSVRRAVNERYPQAKPYLRTRKGGDGLDAAVYLSKHPRPSAESGAPGCAI